MVVLQLAASEWFLFVRKMLLLIIIIIIIIQKTAILDTAHILLKVLI